MKKVTRTRKPTVYNTDTLKKEFNISSSEELFDITSEIDRQCPGVDIFLEDLKNLANHIDTLKSLIEDNENNINKPYIDRKLTIINGYDYSLRESFEEMRTACEKLRFRGEDWKRLAKTLFNVTLNNKKYLDPKIQEKL